MDRKELDRILESHRKWLAGEEGGERADLRRADLQGADLQGADLQEADLQEADLRWADLRWADLQGADLQGADLQEADIQGAYLQEADLRWADLRWADLQGAYLRGADLYGANLDYSGFPLSCGGSCFKCGSKLVRQLFAHICTLEVVDADDDMKAAIEAIRSEAKKSHRAEDMGLLNE